MRIGVLALQGAFIEHVRTLRAIGAEPVEVRLPEDLEGVHGLIIPGGESTTMLKLLEIEGLTDAVRDFGKRKPIYGTCAGAILLAHEVTHPPQASLDLMDISVERNGYGRQIDSRIAKVPVNGGGEFEAVFIRAPIIRKVGDGANVLASYQGDPVWVEQGRHMVTTFHPELTDDPRIHRRFVEKL